MASSSHEPTLHVWPGAWELPSIHPQCLAAILYLQLATPGKFIVQECVSPDTSPNGQLPYLTHGESAFSTLSSIVKHVSGLKIDDEDGHRHTADLDESLSPLEKVQRTAWIAYVDVHIGDLVACSLFTLGDNYWSTTRPTLSAALPFPQRYFLPDRLREQYHPRLEAAGLWSMRSEGARRGGERPAEASRQTGRRSILGDRRVHDTFAKEKVLEKARTHFDILTRLLGSKEFFYRERPTSLDTLLAAHTLLLLTHPPTPAPGDILRDLLAESYPALHAHARRVYALAVGGEQDDGISASVSFLGPAPLPAGMRAAEAPLRVLPVQPRLDLAALVPHILAFSRRRAKPTPTPHAVVPAVRSESEKAGQGEKEGDEEVDATVADAAEERAFARARWLWIGGAVLAVLGWASAVRLRIVFVSAGAGEDEGEGEYAEEGDEYEEPGEEVGEHEDDDEEGDVEA